MTYPHTLTLTRTAIVDDGMGGSTAGATTTVYSGSADVQEGGVEHRMANGVVTSEGDAVAFLPAAVSSIRPGDAGTITWGDGTTTPCTVARLTRLDDSLILKYA